MAGAERDHKVVYRAVADFSAIRKEAAKTRAALKDQEKAEKSAGRESVSTNKKVTGAVEDLTGARKKDTSATEAGTSAQKSQNAVFDSAIANWQRATKSINGRTDATRRSTKETNNSLGAVKSALKAHSEFARSARSSSRSVDRYSESVKRSSRSTDKASRSTSRFGASLRNLGSKIGNSNKRLKRMGSLIFILGTGIVGLIGAAITPLFSALTSLGGALVVVAGGLAEVSGIAAVVPGTLFAIITAAAGVKVAMGGMSDAFKLFKEEADGEAPKTFAEALAKLSPAARSVVKSLTSLYPAWQKIQMATQESLFKPLVGEMGSLKKLLPVVSTLLTSAASAVGKLGAKFLKMASSQQWIKSLNSLSGSNAKLIKIYGDSLLTVADAFRKITVAAQPLTTAVARVVKGLSGDFSKWTSSLKKGQGPSKSFAATIDKILLRFNQLIDITKNLGSIIASTFRAAGGAIDWFMDRFVGVTEGWAELASISADDGGGMKKFFDDLIPVMSEFSKLFSDLVKMLFEYTDLAGFTTFIKSLRADFIPALGRLLELMSDPELIQKFVGLLVDFTDILTDLIDSGLLVGLETFLGIISGLAAGIKKLAATPVLGEGLTAIVTALSAFAALSLTGNLLKRMLSPLTKMAKLAPIITNMVKALAAGSLLSGGFKGLMSKLGLGMKNGLAGSAVALKGSASSLTASASALMRAAAMLGGSSIIPGKGGKGKYGGVAGSKKAGAIPKGVGVAGGAAGAAGAKKGAGLASKVPKGAGLAGIVASVVGLIAGSAIKDGGGGARDDVGSGVSNVAGGALVGGMIPGAGPFGAAAGATLGAAKTGADIAGKDRAAGTDSFAKKNSDFGGFGNIESISKMVTELNDGGIEGLTKSLRDNREEWPLSTRAVVGATESLAESALNLPSALENVSAGLGSIASFVGGVFTGLFEIVSNVLSPLTALVQGVFAIVASVASGLFRVVSAAFQGIGQIIGSAMNLVGAIISRAWAGITGIVSSALSTLSGFVGSVWSSITNKFKAPLEAAKSWVSSTWASLTGKIEEPLEAATSWVGSTWAGITDAIIGPLQQVKEFVDGAFSGLAAKISGAASKASGILDNLSSKVSGSGGGSGSPAGSAEGGAISGPGTGTSDSIPAMLSNGEYVIKASSAKKIGSARLAALNSTGKEPRKFAGGGSANIGKAEKQIRKQARSFTGKARDAFIAGANISLQERRASDYSAGLSATKQAAFTARNVGLEQIKAQAQATKDLVKAQKDELLAIQNKTAAEVTAKRSLEDLQRSIGDINLDRGSSAASVQQALESLQRVSGSGTSTKGDVLAAQSAYDQALASQRDVEIQFTRNSEDLASLSAIAASLGETAIWKANSGYQSALDSVASARETREEISAIANPASSGGGGRKKKKKKKKKRAMGGSFNWLEPFLAGENGPEIIFPESAGRVMTAPQSAKLLSNSDSLANLVGAISGPSYASQLGGVDSSMGQLGSSGGSSNNTSNRETNIGQMTIVNPLPERASDTIHKRLAKLTNREL
jgi:hypothetical protein